MTKAFVLWTHLCWINEKIECCYYQKFDILEYKLWYNFFCNKTCSIPVSCRGSISLIGRLTCYSFSDSISVEHLLMILEFRFLYSQFYSCFWEQSHLEKIVLIKSVDFRDYDWDFFKKSSVWISCLYIQSQIH